MALIDYNNPNDPWMHIGYDPFKGMDEKDKMLAGCMQGFTFLIVIVVFLLLSLLFSGCTTTKYVPVPEVHEIHHNHTDSVIQRDSVVKETLTTVMQLDSAAMAQYGIQLKSAERAWLVRTAELERQIQQLKELRNDSIQKADNIPYPVEVPKEVPAELTWWQQTRIHIANVVLYILGLGALFMCVKRYFKP